jgi:hypothetical protein
MICSLLFFITQARRVIYQFKSVKSARARTCVCVFFLRSIKACCGLEDIFSLTFMYKGSSQCTVCTSSLTAVGCVLKCNCLQFSVSSCGLTSEYLRILIIQISLPIICSMSKQCACIVVRVFDEVLIHITSISSFSVT